MARSSYRRKGRLRAPAGAQVKPPGKLSSSLVAEARTVQSVRQNRPRKPVIFISYSHRDRRLVGRILVHLRPLEHYGSVVIWEDSRIRPGTKWRIEIAEALNNAIAAILVVSADFLASDFVMNQEVPMLLRSAESRGTAVIPLIVGPCLFTQSVLGCFQPINSPEDPLSKLSPHKRDEILVRLAISIASCFLEAG